MTFHLRQYFWVRINAASYSCTFQSGANYIFYFNLLWNVFAFCVCAALHKDKEKQCESPLACQESGEVLKAIIAASASSPKPSICLHILFFLISGGSAWLGSLQPPAVPAPHPLLSLCIWRCNEKMICLVQLEAAAWRPGLFKPIIPGLRRRAGDWEVFGGRRGLAAPLQLLFVSSWPSCALSASLVQNTRLPSRGYEKEESDWAPGSLSASWRGWTRKCRLVMCRSILKYPVSET